MKISPISFNNKNSSAPKRINQPAFKGGSYYDDVLKFTQKAFSTEVYNQSFKPLVDFANDKNKLLKELFKLSKKIGMSTEKFQQYFKGTQIYKEVKELPSRSGKSDNFWLRTQKKDSSYNLSLVRPFRADNPGSFFSYTKQGNVPLYGQFKAFEMTGEIMPEHKVQKRFEYQLFNPDSGYIDSIGASYLGKEDEFMCFDLETTPRIFENNFFLAKMFGLETPNFSRAFEAAKTYKRGQTGAVGDFYIKKLKPFGLESEFDNRAQITNTAKLNGFEDVRVAAVFNFDKPEKMGLLIGRFGV